MIGIYLLALGYMFFVKRRHLHGLDGNANVAAE